MTLIMLHSCVVTAMGSQSAPSSIVSVGRTIKSPTITLECVDFGEPLELLPEYTGLLEWTNAET